MGIAIEYDITKERGMRKKRIYYHITNVKNRASIRKKGIYANEEGHIFVITDKDVAPIIVTQQLFIKQYALFLIDSTGITGKVIRDRVAEFTARYHRIIMQENIPKEYVHFWGVFDIDVNKLSKWFSFTLSRLQGLSEEDAEKQYYKERAELEAFRRERHK